MTNAHRIPNDAFLVGVRYCFLCQCIKPDRAHHCSVCGKCVLRYDHHCPWWVKPDERDVELGGVVSRTNSCVSFANYKFFVLFLGWALTFCAYVAATSLEYFIIFWQVMRPTPFAPLRCSTNRLFCFFAACRESLIFRKYARVNRELEHRSHALVFASGHGQCAIPGREIPFTLSVFRVGDVRHQRVVAVLLSSLPDEQESHDTR